MKFFTALVTTFATMMLTSGCMEDTPKGGPGGSGEKTQGEVVLEQVVIDNIARNVIVATYRDLRDCTQEMARLAGNLQASPSDGQLQQVQAQWRLCRIPWESSEGFVFGPALEIDPTIDSWPLSIISLNGILDSQAQISAAFIRSQGNDVKGFHTAEFLLFGDGLSKNTKSVAEMTPRQIEYLVAVTAVLSEYTANLYRQWTEQYDLSVAKSKSFVDIVLTPSLENQLYPTRSAVLQQFVQGMKKIAAEVGDSKLRTPLGGDIDHAEGSQVESQFSWNSLADFQNNVHSIRNIYTGDYGNRSGAGLDEIVKLKNPDLNLRVLAEIDAAETAISAIAGPDKLSYTLAIKNPEARARTALAIKALAKLFATLQSDLLPVFR